jgi:CRISPR-associated endonuclease Cas1
LEQNGTPLAADTLQQSPSVSQLHKHSVLVLHGFAISLRVDRNHLCAQWGVGLDRYKVRLSRVEGHKLRRVVLLGSEGYISLEALRFITDVGATFSMIDRRGKALIVCSPIAPSDSKLRRAQSLAITNGTALRISTEILSEKLAGQAVLARDMLHNDSVADVILRFKAELLTAQSISSVRIIEAQAAKEYWSAWTDVPIRWAHKDERRIPAHWKIFGSRISQLTHSPRAATNPPNACMNLLHCLGENESRVALVACGLDPDIGCLHADTPGRSSLASDLQEILRPKVDAFVLNFIQNEVLRKSDFWEDRYGCCRLSTDLAIKLISTSDTWRRFLNPWAERIATMLWASTSSKLERQLLATRLTQRHRRASKGSVVPAVDMPKIDMHVCVDCGAPVRCRDRGRCSKCAKAATKKNFNAGRKAAQQPEHRAKMANTMRAHRRAISNWKPSDLPTWLTREVYISRIVPALATVPKIKIRSALGVSEPYASGIRSGKVIPHKRSWQKLAALAGIEG